MENTTTQDEFVNRFDSADNELEKHVRFLGWAFIVMNALALVFGGVIGFFMLVLGLFSGDGDAMGMMAFMSIFIFGMMMLFAVPGIITGWGLLKRKSWARLAALVLGVVNIFSFPIGTAVGAYTLWVLAVQEGSREYFLQPKFA